MGPVFAMAGHIQCSGLLKLAKACLQVLPNFPHDIREHCADRLECFQDIALVCRAEHSVVFEGTAKIWSILKTKDNEDSACGPSLVKGGHGGPTNHCMYCVDSKVLSSSFKLTQ